MRRTVGLDAVSGALPVLFTALRFHRSHRNQNAINRRNIDGFRWIERQPPQPPHRKYGHDPTDWTREKRAQERTVASVTVLAQRVNPGSDAIVQRPPSPPEPLLDHGGAAFNWTEPVAKLLDPVTAARWRTGRDAVAALRDPRQGRNSRLRVKTGEAARAAAEGLERYFADPANTERLLFAVADSAEHPTRLLSFALLCNDVRLFHAVVAGSSPPPRDSAAEGSEGVLQSVPRQLSQTIVEAIQGLLLSGSSSPTASSFNAGEKKSVNETITTPDDADVSRRLTQALGAVVLSVDAALVPEVLHLAERLATAGADRQIVDSAIEQLSAALSRLPSTMLDAADGHASWMLGAVEGCARHWLRIAETLDAQYRWGNFVPREATPVPQQVPRYLCAAAKHVIREQLRQLQSSSLSPLSSRRAARVRRLSMAVTDLLALTPNHCMPFGQVADLLCHIVQFDGVVCASASATTTTAASEQSETTTTSLSSVLGAEVYLPWISIVARFNTAAVNALPPALLVAFFASAGSEAISAAIAPEDKASKARLGRVGHEVLLALGGFIGSGSVGAPGVETVLETLVLSSFPAKVPVHTFEAMLACAEQVASPPLEPTSRSSSSSNGATSTRPDRFRRPRTVLRNLWWIVDNDRVADLALVSSSAWVQRLEGLQHQL